MSEKRKGPRAGVRRWAALWALWSSVGLLIGLQVSTVERVAFPGRVELWRPFAIQFLCYQFWWLLTPLVVWLARRFPLDDADPRRTAVVHGFASMLVPAAYLTVCHYLVLVPLGPVPYRPPTLGLSIGANMPQEFLTYCFVVAAAHLWGLQEKRQERDLRDARLRAQLVDAELMALRMQLQPHFLFNALNSISALVREDPDAADRMLARLGDLLRLTLESGDRPVVPLRQEVEILKHYLAIEEVRFADRLSVSLSIEPELLEALVPSLILQPLVENAIRHGVARSGASARIEVAARMENGALQLSVRNDGPALLRPIAEGLGIRNTRARLEQLYGSEQALEMADDPKGGVRTRIRLPLGTGRLVA